MIQTASLRALCALFVVLLTACVAPESEQPPSDGVLARNMAAVTQQPGVADLDWRQPKEVIKGAPAKRFAVKADHFPAPEALANALAYSEAQDGRGFMVWFDGAVVASEFAEGLDATEHTATYSMHKSVLAIALLQAVEAGVITSIDDPVGRYVDEWRADPRGALTFRDLVTHVSGLEHHAMNSGSPKAANLILSDRIRETALSFESAMPSEREFNYNNVNSQIAGIALEAALAQRGLRYSEFLSQQLWQPLGNQDAAIWMEKVGGTARFASGLEAGLADWLAIGVMLANGGQYDGQQVLTEAAVKTLFSATALNPAYGLGIWRGEAWAQAREYGPGTALKVLHSAPYLAPDVYYFDGFGGQRVYVVPSKRLVVARTGEVNFAYDDASIVNTLLRGLMQADQQQSQADYQSDNVAALYQQRFERLMREAGRGGGLAAYDPLTPLLGAAEHTFLPVKSDAAPWLNADVRQAINAYLAPRNTQAFFVWHRGQLVMAEYYGENTPESMVISRSLSKPLSVVAAGRAIQLGFLKTLDQPAANYLHEWQGTDKAGITIRQILQMRSGLEPQRPSRDPLDIMNKAYLHPYHAEVIINEYPLVSEPGSRYDYSNANGELVAPILERATGQRYEDWISREVLQPLGAPGGSIWLNREGGTAHSGCCALLPAETWLRLSTLLMRDGLNSEGIRLLPEGFVQMMTTPTPQNPHTAMGVYVAGNYIENRGAANPDVPFGKNFHSEPYLDRDLFLFDGNGHQVSYHIPRHELIVTRVGKAPPEELPWDNAYLPNTVLRALAAGTGAELVEQPMP